MNSLSMTGLHIVLPNLDAPKELYTFSTYTITYHHQLVVPYTPWQISEFLAKLIISMHLVLPLKGLQRMFLKTLRVNSIRVVER